MKWWKSVGPTSWYLAMPPFTAASMTPFRVILSRLMLPWSCLCWYWLIRVRSSWFLFSTTQMAFSNGLTSNWVTETCYTCYTSFSGLTQTTDLKCIIYVHTVKTNVLNMDSSFLFFKKLKALWHLHMIKTDSFYWFINDHSPYKSTKSLMLNINYRQCFIHSPVLSSPPQTSERYQAEGEWGSGSSSRSRDSEKHKCI